MLSTWIDRVIVFLVVADVAFNAQQLGMTISQADCTQQKCHEITLSWYDNNPGIDKNSYSDTTAKDCETSNQQLKGTRTQHKTITVTKKFNCTGNCTCNNPGAKMPYEGNGYNNCNNPQGGYYRYFCATFCGQGKKGSWNEGKDDGTAEGQIVGSGQPDS